MWKLSLAPVTVLALGLLCSSLAGAAEVFPRVPNLGMTPGSLCPHADSYRYAEHIPYCERNVDSSEKREIMRSYDERLGYDTTQLPRGEFKIDHLIPLCMGGSNQVINLWPQHRSIYELTDKAEGLLCVALEAGRMTQKEAVAEVLNLKQHPETGPALAAQLQP